MRILVVEDEFNLADVISSRLKKEKYTVDVATDGEDGLFNALSGIYNLIILDVMLPSVDGFEILKQVREKGIDVKVIMLTARSELEDKLSLRDRSMITISALMAQGLFPQLKSHFEIGKKHGITKEEAVEIVTQLAFYAGWPKAWSAFGIIKEVYGDDGQKRI